MFRKIETPRLNPDACAECRPLCDCVVPVIAEPCRNHLRIALYGRKQGNGGTQALGNLPLADDSEPPLA